MRVTCGTLWKLIVYFLILIVKAIPEGRALPTTLPVVIFVIPLLAWWFHLSLRPLAPPRRWVCTWKQASRLVLVRPRKNLTCGSVIRFCEFIGIWLWLLGVGVVSSMNGNH